MKSWAIYIDIEGFSANYSRDCGRVITGLQNLMENIYLIGTKVCSERSKRLCAYQAGDGFFIDSEYGDTDVTIAIAVILMRSALLAGALTRAGISEGDCVDIRGWRPDIVRQHAEGDKVRLGETGHMRLFPVMGTAYIKAHAMTKAKAKGCLLLLDSEMAARSSGESVTLPRIDGCRAIDWVHADLPEIHHIASAADIFLGDPDALEEQLKKECKAVPRFSGYAAWLKNTLTFNNCES
jgi:hypothetical protein